MPQEVRTKKKKIIVTISIILIISNFIIMWFVEFANYNILKFGIGCVMVFGLMMFLMFYDTKPLEDNEE